MNLPNILTLARIAMIPLFLVAFMSDWAAANVVAMLIFAVASFTDFLDGYIARRDNLVTNFGKIMDPLADKLLVLTALVALVAYERVAVWIVVVIIGRELAVTSLRAVAAGEGIIVAASPLGKWKTVFQMAALILLILNISFGTYVLYVAVALTIISGLDYVIKLSKHIRWM